MATTPRFRYLAALGAICLLAAACGGGGDKDQFSGGDGGDKKDSDTSGAVTSVEEAKGAVVQVVSEGEFRDPEVGTVSGAGSGSGFIVDPSGLVVTNNHVVTGAGSLKVLVGGEEEEISAEVLGVSECNDLAVLQLDDKGPWPFLAWSSEAVEPPTDVYALGFPLGDPEFTATKGVVSKAEADGETSWASVEEVIEHDANIQPGNSGGPLVTDDGQVVAVNYAAYTPSDSGTEQFFAIPSALASDVVDTLKDGDKESIGVNGSAVLDEEAGIAGVWVNGVDPGGPADEVGVLPGDIITNLNGVQLDSGTYEEYCDVLRSAGEEEPISIRVLRFDTEEELEGELFGEPLTATYSFASEYGSDLEEGDGEGATLDEYVEVTDDTGRIVTAVPPDWTDVDTASQDLLGLGSPQPTLIAAPSIADFDGGAGPGAAVVVIDGATGLDPNELLNGAVQGSGCTESTRDQYDDSVLAGPFAIASCPDGTTAVILTATLTANPDVMVLVIGMAVTDDDLAIIDNVLYGLYVD